MKATHGPMRVLGSRSEGAGPPTQQKKAAAPKDSGQFHSGVTEEEHM